MTGSVLIIAECWKGEIETITFQALTKGRELADNMNVELGVLVVGSQLDISSLRDKGMDALWVVDDATLADAAGNVQAHVIAEAVRRIEPRVVIIGYSLVGMEWAPAVAAYLGVTAMTNCVDVAFVDGNIAITRPFYEGSVHVEIILDGPGPAVVALQKGATPVQPLASKSTSVQPITIDMSGITSKGRVVEWVETPAGGVDITKADILVSVGRGIGSQEKLSLIDQLTSALGGVMSCSRPLVDQGWLPLERQVGASGKTVTPKVYLACGISGASQHLAGMSDAKTIIAINKDPNAPIFQIAHYGIVRDLFEIAPALIEQAKK